MYKRQLGGSGGGIAHDEQELIDILSNGLRLSRVGEVLVERCIAGWKEIEYEVMRDANGNCITVCNICLLYTSYQWLSEVACNTFRIRRQMWV